MVKTTQIRSNPIQNDQTHSNQHKLAQGPSGIIGGHLWSTAVIGGHRRSLAVIGGHQGSSAVIGGLRQYTEVFGSL